MIKTRIRNAVLCLFGLLLLSALAVEAVERFVIGPRTVSSPEDILEQFYQSRSSIPPLPPPISYQTVAEQISQDRFDFLATPNWAFNHSGGTLYLSEKSKLKFSLPMLLVAYEDLASGKVVLTGTPVGTKDIQTLTIVDAPEFAPYDEKVPIDSYLLKEIGPRRMIWTATLKSESDAWVDMIKAEEAVTLSVAPMMMAMSAPEAITEIQLGIENLTNGTVELHVQWPAGFSDTLEIYSATDLVAANWEFAHTNISTASSSEHFWHDTRTNSATRFYVAGNADYDEDGDGLASTREKYIYKTDPLLFDTDGDGLGDGWELLYGFNPLLASASESLGDADGDGYSNLEEQTAGTDPTSSDATGSTGTVATIRYYYDEDDRLTDSFVGMDVAEQTQLSLSGNIVNEVQVQN